MIGWFLRSVGGLVGAMSLFIFVALLLSTGQALSISTALGVGLFAVALPLAIGWGLYEWGFFVQRGPVLDRYRRFGGRLRSIGLTLAVATMLVGAVILIRPGVGQGTLAEGIGMVIGFCTLPLLVGWAMTFVGRRLARQQSSDDIAIF